MSVGDVTWWGGVARGHSGTVPDTAVYQVSTYHGGAARSFTDSLIPGFEVKKATCRNAGLEPLQVESSRPRIGREKHGKQEAVSISDCFIPQPLKGVGSQAQESP